MVILANQGAGPRQSQEALLLTWRRYSTGFRVCASVSVSPHKLEQPEIQDSGCIKNVPFENLGQPFFSLFFGGSKRDARHSPLDVSFLQGGVSYSIFPFIYKFSLSVRVHTHTHTDFGKDVCCVEVNGVMTTASLSCRRTSADHE